MNLDIVISPVCRGPRLSAAASDTIPAGHRIRVSPDASDPSRCQTGLVEVEGQTGVTEPSAAILIVDDHDGCRAFARAMLEAAGFTVAEAATGAEATEAARRVQPRL